MRMLSHLIINQSKKKKHGWRRLTDELNSDSVCSMFCNVESCEGSVLQYSFTGAIGAISSVAKVETKAETLSSS